MRILLINHYAGSLKHGMEYRPYYLSREWVRAGHNIRILAATYSHVRSRQPDIAGQAIMKRHREVIDGIEYVWYPTPMYQGNGVGRVLNIWAFLRQVWFDTHRTVRDFQPDVVIASSTYPLDIWVARRLALLAKARLIYEVHDLWPLSPIELGGMSPHHPFIMLCQWAENTAYRDADLVVSMPPKVHEHMAAHGLDLKKLHIIPNGISPDDWTGEGQPLNAALAACLHNAHQKGLLIVGYAGSHGLPNALDALLDAAKSLVGQPLRFVLVGDGHEKARLQERVAAEGITNVEMWPPVPKAQVPALLREFDVAYLGWRRCPIYRFGISPNKLMDYMMACRPVLHAVEAGNDPVAEAGCGVTVAPESPRSIGDGLQEFLKMEVGQRESMGRKGRDYAEKNHTYPVLAKRFLAIMENGEGERMEG